MRSRIHTTLLVVALIGTGSLATGQIVSRAATPPPAAGLAMQDVIDFEGLPAGTVVDQVTSAGGAGPIVVFGSSPFFPGENAAIIFDSANPTGGDVDLGTPNEDFFGPGIGAGGELGSPFQNDTALGNLLIIAENLNDDDGDGLIDIPDDGDLVGNLVVLGFDAIGPVTIHSITLIDVEADRQPATVELLDADDAQLALTVLPQVSDNGVAVVDLGDVGNVATMIVTLNGSGGIDNIVFTPPDVPCTGLVGDFVWHDLDVDGLQDPGEPGLEGVVVRLCDALGNELATTVTNEVGLYLFTDLCAGDYVVKVDESTLPPGFEPSPCNVGPDDTIDNDCTPCLATLPEDDSEDRTCDFGYYVPDMGGGGDGCTPGYWKQPQHFDDWPEDVDQGDPFGMYFENAFPGMSLLQVLQQGGGGLKALGRHTVAAWLNTQNDDVDYDLSTAEVVAMFNGVFPGTKQQYNGLKDIFEDFNQQGCPLGNDGGGGNPGGSGQGIFK